MMLQFREINAILGGMLLQYRFWPGLQYRLQSRRAYDVNLKTKPEVAAQVEPLARNDGGSAL